MLGRNQIKKKGKDLDRKIEDGDYLGLTVVCEDECLRKVYNVASPVIQDKSQAWKKGLLIINEGDPLQPDGHWVTILAMECALNHDPQPNKEARQAWLRLSSQITTMNLASVHNAQKQGKMPFDFSDQ